MLTRKEKMTEFEAIAQSIGHIPTPKDNLYFSDGGNVYFWYSHILQFLKKKSLQAKQEEQEEVRHFVDRVESTYGKQAKLRGRIQEYASEVKRLKHNVTLQSGSLFQDGVDKGYWYQTMSDKMKKWRNQEKELSSQEMIEVQMFAELDDLLYSYSPSVRFQAKIEEFMKFTEDNQSIPTRRHPGYFVDHTRMDKWYNDQKAKMRRWENDLNTLSEEEKKQYQLFQKLEKWIETGFSKRTKYKKKIDELHYVIQYTYEFPSHASTLAFDDGTSMYEWIREQRRTFRKWLVEDRKLNEEEQERLYLFATLENELYNLRKNSWNTAYGRKLCEYVNACLEGNKKITKKDPHRFQDGTHMGSWFYGEQQRFETFDPVSQKQKEKKELFQAASDILDSHFSKVSQWKKQISIYEVACLQRNKDITRRFDESFANGKSMSEWKYRALKQLKRLLQKDTLTKEEEEIKNILLQFENFLYEQTGKKCYRQGKEKKIKK